MTLLDLYQAVENITRQNAGQAKMQPFFEAIYELALIGMNARQGGCIESSGELAVLEYVKKRLAAVPRPVVFDIGANVGGYTEKVLECFGGTVELFSFEPSAKTFQTLQRRLGGRNVNLYNCGFADKSGLFTLYSDSENSGLACLTERQLSHLNIKMNRHEKVYIRTLDEFCEEASINRIHLLKVDVEGWELAVFHGAQQLLARRAIDFIQFEFGGCNIDTKTYLRDFWHLLSKDFTFYRVMQDGLAPINSYQEQREIFTTTNYFLGNKYFDEV